MLKMHLFDQSERTNMKKMEKKKREERKKNELAFCVYFIMCQNIFFTTEC